MAHPNETITCPNCGCEATANFCAQCGQETHLHKETFWGLIGHFVGHYFHYDSKFWQTMKTLWFAPGKLTIAYWDKQRMRYIPPISLYIFISAVYFLIAFSFPKPPDRSDTTRYTTEVTDSNGVTREVDVDSLKWLPPASRVASNRLEEYLQKKAGKIAAEHHTPTGTYLNEKLSHTFPRIMFFMIPVLAWLLKMRFRKRKELYFVDHAIFAIHIHCFWFSITLFHLVHINKKVDFLIYLVLIIIFFIHSVRSTRNVYKLGRFNAVATVLGVAYVYSFLMSVAVVTTVLIYFMLG